MFYVVDQHFEMFFKQRQKKQEEILTVFETGKKEDKLSQLINLDTLTGYLHSKFPERDHSHPLIISRLFNELSDSNYRTIEDLEELINYGWSAFEAFEENELLGEKYTDAGAGIYN